MGSVENRHYFLVVFGVEDVLVEFLVPVLVDDFVGELECEEYIVDGEVFVFFAFVVELVDEFVGFVYCFTYIGEFVVSFEGAVSVCPVCHPVECVSCENEVVFFCDVLDDVDLEVYIRVFGKVVEADFFGFVDAGFGGVPIVVCDVSVSSEVFESFVRSDCVVENIVNCVLDFCKSHICECSCYFVVKVLLIVW